MTQHESLYRFLSSVRQVVWCAGSERMPCVGVLHHLSGFFSRQWPPCWTLFLTNKQSLSTFSQYALWLRFYSAVVKATLQGIRPGFSWSRSVQHEIVTGITASLLKEKWVFEWTSLEIVEISKNNCLFLIPAVDLLHLKNFYSICSAVK